MCIPPFFKYMLLALIVGVLLVLAVFLEKQFYLLPMMVFAIIWSRVRCTKCQEPILKDKNGWYMFTVRPTCRHCGQDTMLCK